MPVTIKEQAAEPLRERLDAFRRTITPGQGWTAAELAEKLDVSVGSLNMVFLRHKWTVKRYLNGRPRLLLVNPKDLCQPK